MPKLFYCTILLLSVTAYAQNRVDSTSKNELYFISDTQQPMAIEKSILHANHNEKATSLLLSAILKNKPQALYMLGDVVAIGSNNHKWYAIDKFLDSCRSNNIAVHALLGNHDIMWSRKKGESNFQERFPDNVATGFVSTKDSIAIVMLNSNFSKLSRTEIDIELRWYESTLEALNTDNSVKTIIVCCHHAPFSNSKIVGSSSMVQRYFLPAFYKMNKCKVFIAGHAHAFEHFKYRGKDFLVIGGGGGLHQPLDTSAKRLPDVAYYYKPMFHYLSIQRNGDQLLLSSYFLKPDFLDLDKGYSFEVTLLPTK